MVLCERVNNKNKTNLLFCGTVHYVVQSRLRIQPFRSSLQGTFHGRDVCDPMNSILMTWICPESAQRARNVPSGDEREETAVFEGYVVQCFPKWMVVPKAFYQ